MVLGADLPQLDAIALTDLLARNMKLQFDAGAFVALDGSNIVVNLTVHEDGIVVETKHGDINNAA